MADGIGVFNSFERKRWAAMPPPNSKIAATQQQSLAKEMQQYQEDIIAPLKAEEAKLTVASTHVNGLLQLFKGLQAATYNLTSFSTFSPYIFQSTQSDEAVSVSIKGGSKPSTADLNILVQSIAKTDRIISDSNNVFSSNTNALNLAGNLVLNGTTITLDATDTLESVAEKIQSNTPIRAWITKLDQDQYVLSLEHPDLCTPIDGSASDSGIWDSLHLPPTTTLSDLQAHLTVNGVSGIRRNSNTISDSLPGLEITLNKQSATPTQGKVVENNEVFEAKLSAFANAYNACQKAIADENARDPNDPTKAATTAILKDFVSFTQLESFMRIPWPSQDSEVTFMSLGYKQENGFLVKDETYKDSNLSIHDRIHFFRDTATTSDHFTQSMPSTFDRDTQRNINSLGGKAISIVITHNLDDTYTATLKAEGIADLSLPYNPSSQKIVGTESFIGLNLTYDGVTPPNPGDSVSGTVTLHTGMANNFYRTVDKTITTQPDIPSTFDALAKEIEQKKERNAKTITEKNNYMESKMQKALENTGKLAALETKMASVEKLVKGALFGRKYRDE